jgi:predicted patatin/cPLA2 family phospholipase
LSVEGGGMRGIVTAAMLSALQDLNILDLFDSFYASSSGCANLAYVLAGQAWEGTSIYYDKLATRHFIDPSRALYHRNIMDMNYVQQLWNEEVPLDIPAVLNSKKDIVFALSNVSELTGILKRDFLDEADFLSSQARTSAS